ncbi:MAG: hypothetical protein KDA96_03705, partial [Planctomycetaceae bacterium]|nr:hypothetical protein [Planctomycetaceae bacterium]
AMESRQLEEVQRTWLQNTVLMCLSKERVVGVYYLHWADETKEDTTGLVRTDGAARPSLDILTALHQTFWNTTDAQ